MEFGSGNCKGLEVAVALGIDFGSNKEAIRGEISRREKADFERLRGADGR